MQKFRNKYRIESSRFKCWDYGWQGSYYITIVTNDRENYFGEIIGGKMFLNDIGKIAHSEWLKSPEIRPDMNLELGEFVVMPNHIHGIIDIGRNEFNRITSLMKTEEVIESKVFGPQKKNISSIMRGFKSSVTKQAHIIDPKFNWQERFHDHVIRSHQEYLIISEYIRTNPENWNGEIIFFS